MNLTLGMAAKHLGVTKSTLSKAIHSGKLSAERGRMAPSRSTPLSLIATRPLTSTASRKPVRKRLRFRTWKPLPTRSRKRLSADASNWKPSRSRPRSSQRQLVDRPRRPFQRVQGEVGAAGEGLALMVLQLPCRVAPSLPPACDTQTLKTKGDYSYDNNARPGGSGPDRRKRMGAARRAVAGAGHHAQ